MFQHSSTSEKHFIVPTKERAEIFVNTWKKTVTGDCEAVLTVRKPGDEAFTFTEMDTVSTISVESFRTRRKKPAPLSVKTKKAQQQDAKHPPRMSDVGCPSAPWDSALVIPSASSSASSTRSLPDKSWSFQNSM